MKHRSLLRKIVSVGLLLSVLSPAMAQNYTVTSTGDFPITGGVNSTNGVITGGAGNGLVTLRSAISAANTAAGAHTINLPAGTYNLLIAGPAESFGGDITIGDLDVLRSDVTIQGAGMNTTVINQTTGVERVFDVNVNYVSGNVFNFTITGVTVSGGRSNAANGSTEGGGIFSGNNNANGTVTVTNCKFLNNQTSGAGFGGGALSNVGGNLVVTGCIFGGVNPTDFNQSGTSGGAIYWDARDLVQTFTCTNNTFTNNIALSGAAGGGAIDIAAVNLGTGTANISGCTFTANHANNAGGGALMNESTQMNVSNCTFINNTAKFGGVARNAGGTGTNINFSRLIGNTASTSGQAFDAVVALNANNNWWGVNSGPAAGSLSGAATATVWLQLKSSATPVTICGAGSPTSSTVTSGFLSNSAGTAIAPANLTALVGVPISFVSPVLGTLSAAQPTIQVSGTATVLFTSTGTAGAGSVNAVVDNVPAADALAKASITINKPTVTNPGVTTGTVGTAFSQTFTQAGGALPVSFTTASTLPTGITLTASSGVLGGTPTQSGSFPIVVVVTDNNGCTGTSATYTLVISCQAITVTNPGVTTATNGTPFSQTFTQVGALGGATFTLNSGSIPNPLLLSAAGVLSGTPSAPAATYPMTIKVTDGNGCTGVGGTYSLVLSNAPIPPFNIGTIPKGDSIVIQHDVTIVASPPPGTNHIAAQWTIQGSNFANFVSDDPDTAPALDSTITPLVLCPTITVNNPVNTTGTYNVPFSETFTASGGTSPYTFTTASVLPTGLTLSSAGVLSGTPTQGGTYNIVVTAKETGSTCTGVGTTYVLVISCPAPVSGTATPSSQTICSGPVTTIVLSGAPAGAVYNWTRDNNVAVTGIAASGAGDISGTLTNTTGVAQTVTFTITPVAFGSCNQTPYTATVTVTQNNTITLTSAAGTNAQTVCINTPITNITYSTTGATGATFSGLPAGVTGAWAANVVTISGTPTAAGPFSYTVTLTGGCGNITANGTITVSPNNTITLTSAAGTNAQTVCINLPITNITYSTTGATGATFSGLPAGVTGNWAANVVTISGTPTASGPFSYTVTLTGGCGVITANGTISVTANSTITLTSAAGTNAQTVCINTPIINITYSTTGATGATFSGLPAGVTGAWAANVVTISGSPTASGPFSYTVTLTGGCGIITANGTISVTPNNTITLTSAAGTNAQTKCINTPITNITYSTTGATGATFTGLPAGVTGAWAANVVTISGTPTASGPFSYTVTLTGGCGNITANGTITVTPNNTITLTSAPGTNNQTVLINTPITNITYSTTGATGATFSGLPTGVTGNWAANVVTISGSPSVQGIFNYTVTLTGGCGIVTATGTINVIICSITLTSAAGTNAQYLCFNTAITNITYSTTGATGATFSGLPAGVNGNWAANTVTISGTPTVSGTFNYTVTPTGGGCSGAVTATGTITVASQPAINSVTGDVICEPGGVVNLSAAGNGTINWWNALAGGVVVNTGNTYSPNVTTTTTWYVDATTTTGPQTLLGMPAQSSTFPGQVRGYWFTAPTDFVITSLSVPTTASAGPMSVAVVKFTGNVPPPVFAATTNAFTTMFQTFNNPSLGSVPCNIPVAAGEVIGFLGYRGNINSYAPGDYNTTIAGFPVQLQRLGMQFPLTAAPPHDIWREFGAGTSISRVEFEYSVGPNCVSAPRVPVTATVNPLPDAVATPSSQTICSGSAITTIALTGSIPGTVFNWVRDNTVTVTGIANSGSGNISGSLTNTTNAPVIVTFTITPSYTSGGVTCTGTPITATVVVNPIPNAVATPASQTKCSGSAITTIVLTGNVAGTVYNWTRDNNASVTGIAASGAGNIAGTLTNTTSAAVTVTFTITPAFTNAGTTCTGTPITATVVVNPIPNAVATPASQTICTGSAITTIALTGNVAGTVYNWVRDNNASVTGIAASGTGNIAGSLTNTTSAAVTVTFTITPAFTNAGQTCTGTPITATVVVNPIPNAVATPASQTKCSGSAITTIVLTGNVAGTVYNWTRDNNASVTGIAASGTGNIAGSLTNTTSAPVTVTFTITPAFTNAGTTCTGTPITATVVVNPIPNAVATPASQTICSGFAITTIALTGNVAGTVYSWVRDNTVTVTGIANNGTGNIAGTLTNTTTVPVTVTFTITPSFTNAGTTCTGTPITATVLVNPTPNAVATPASQTVCSGSPVTTIVLSGAVAGTVFNWTRDNTVPVTGIAASGSGNISGTLTNTTTSNVLVTFTITPVANGCTGPSITATVLVKPTPTVTATPPSQTICSGAIAAISFDGNLGGAANYDWTRDNNVTVTGLAASGSGNINAALTNTTAAPVTVTFTITPTFNGCSGTPITATVLVNPTATVVATPPAQTVCSANPITTIVLTSPVAGTTYTWTRDNVGTVTGIANSGSGNIAGTLTNTSNVPVTVTFTITPSANGCTGTPGTATVLVNPTPNAVATPASQTICSASPITTIVLSGVVAGTTYNWTRDNNASVTGIAASGSGNIAGSLTNTTTAPITVTFTITPTANGCPGAPITATVLVNPTPNAVATPASQTICSNATITTIVLSGAVAGTSFNWTRDNNVTVTGIGASGSGNIAGILTNTTNAPITVTFTITPTANGCVGAPITATVLVNPTPNAVAAPASQTICSASPITTIVLTGAVAGTTFNWTRDNNASVTGIAASGSGNIAGTLTNTTFAPVLVTFTITPTANGCPGAPITATVLVNPTPNAVATPAAQTICSGNTITTIVLSGNVSGTTFNWIRNNTATVTGIGASGSGNIAGTLTNTTNAPITVTFTITPTANGCVGAPITATVLVNPTPNAVATPASQTICSASAITTIVMTGAVAGTTYTWTRDNTINVTGIAASGSGNISGTLTNTTFVPVTVTFTITPSANGCPGTPITATVLVNPTPDAFAAPQSQTVCSDNLITPIILSGNVAGTVFNWTRNNTATVLGIPASGSGNISGTLTNTTNAPITVTFTIIPTANGCPGTPITATVLTYPTPSAVATPATQTICSGAAITTIVITGPVAGTTFSWTRNNTGTVLGTIGASGSGNIAGTLINTTTAAITVTFTITTIANGCVGSTTTATVVVNPTPTVTCPANVVVNAAAGTCSAVVTYPPATATGTPAPTITYSIPSGSTFPVGVTTVTVTASNICGTVTCTFTVTVVDVRLPLVSTQPVSTAVCVGNNASFSVVATNVVSYQWQVLQGTSFVNIPGATGTSLALNNTTLSMNGNQYRVALTGPCGTVVFSNVATLVVNPLPVITLSSLSTPILLPSRTVTITATTYPPGGNFVWLKNGAPITGVTGPSLGPLNVGDIGTYRATYTDPNGCINTSLDFLVSLEQTYYLWVYPNPNAGQFNVRYYNRTGENVTLKVFNAMGQQVYAQAITLGTGYSNILVNMSNAAAGVYTVKIMNGYGAELQARRVMIAR